MCTKTALKNNKDKNLNLKKKNEKTKKEKQAIFLTNNCLIAD